MSGVYKPLVITLGALSSILCALLVHRLRLLDSPTPGETFSIFGLLSYVFWLTVEIGKADWAVTKVILGSGSDVRQRLLHVPCGQKSELGRMLFANSITITPGTVTVETEAGYFIVHALTDHASDQESLAQMGSRVTALEKSV